MISNLLARVRNVSPWLLIALGLLTSSTASGNSCPFASCITVWGQYRPWLFQEDLFIHYSGGSSRMYDDGVQERNDGGSEQADPADPDERNDGNGIQCWRDTYDRSAVPNAELRSRVGYRTLDGVTEFHNGIDVAIPTGTTLYAAIGGTVEYVVTGIAENKGTGGGNQVRIRHSDGTASVYLHMRSTDLRVGMVVAAGDVVGASNNTGRSTGPHLHYALRKAGSQWVGPRDSESYHDPLKRFGNCGSGSSFGLDANDIGNG